jgi:hypothetical protein
MKIINRILGIGLMTVSFGAAAFAQDDCDALYQKYKDVYTKTSTADLNTAIDTGKQYVAKCNTEDNKDIVAFIQKKEPALHEIIRKNDNLAVLVKFDDVMKVSQQNLDSVDADAAFSSGRQVLAIDPNQVDVMISLASVGFGKAVAKNDKYDSDTVAMAKMAIQKIESGTTSKQWGVWKHNFAMKDAADTGKANTLGWMNYIIGYITFYSQKNPKESLPYLFKATQYASGTKDVPDIYRMMGSYYLDEVGRIDKERLEKLKAAGDQDTDETKSLLASEKGNADRGIEYYARAYKIATGNPKVPKEARDNFYARMKDLYTFRHNGKADGLDAFVATMTSKPLTNPESPIVPVVEETTTTTTTGTGSGVGAASGTGVGTANGSGVGGAAATGAGNTNNGRTTTGTATKTTTAGATKTTTETKTAPKTVVPKKKGTR